MTTPVLVHTAYAWGRVTEDWLREQVGPVPGFEVRVIVGRRLGAAGQPEIRCVDDGAAGRVWRLADAAHARLQGQRLAPAYQRLIPGGRAAVVHAHFGDWAWSMLPVVARLQAALVVSFYGYDAGSLPRRAGWTRRLGEVFEQAAAVLVEGPAMADRIVGIGCERDRVRIVPLGINIGGDTRARHDGSYRILIACSLREKKGVSDALDAVARAADRLPQRWSLTVAGDGPLRDQLQAQAVALGIAGHTTWLGYVGQDHLQALLADHHVLVQASRTAADGDTEGGAPVILLHAAAAGLPVASTVHADIPFIVTNERTGLLTPEADPAALSESIARLADPALRVRLGDNARAVAVERFSSTRTRGDLAAVYASALRGGDRSGR